MISKTEAIAKFQIPITDLSQVKILQKVLLTVASTNGTPALASLRCLALLFESELQSLLATAVEKVVIENPTEEVLATLTPAQDLVKKISGYSSTLTLAIEEAKAYLQMPVISILREFDTDDISLNKIALASFLILTANLRA